MSDPKRSLGHGLLGRVNLTHQANAAFGDWYERLALNLRDAIRSYSEKASATKASPELTNEGVSAELHRLGAAANREVAGLIVPTVDEIMRRLTAAREKLGAGRALHRGDLDQSNVIGERAGAATSSKRMTLLSDASLCAITS